MRLATSALIAIEEQKLSIGAEEACAALLSGYAETIRDGAGSAFVLEEAHPSLRAMAMSEERDPDRFWSKLTRNTRTAPPAKLRKLLLNELPEKHGKPHFLQRRAGLGALGRPRYVGLALCAGGLAAREAKAMLPSAAAWAGERGGKKLFYDAILEHAIRSPDPFLGTRKGWVLRRLGPHCAAITLADFPRKRDELHILRAMGRETGNVHLGSASEIDAVRRDLKRHRGAWLRDAAGRMAEATLREWKAWRRLKTA